MIFDQEAEYAATHDDLAADVFFGIGADETHEGRAREAANLDAAGASEGLRHLPRHGRRPAALRRPARGRGTTRASGCASEVFPDEFHITVPFLNLSRGLRWLVRRPDLTHAVPAVVTPGTRTYSGTFMISS